jgi:hypothetical protein
MICKIQSSLDVQNLNSRSLGFAFVSMMHIECLLPKDKETDVTLATQNINFYECHLYCILICIMTLCRTKGTFM